MKNSKLHLIIGTVICVSTMILFLAFWNKLPDVVPLQITADGSAGNSFPKPSLVFGLPIIFAVFNLFRGVSLCREENPATSKFYIVPAFAVVAAIVSLIMGLNLQ